MSETGYLHGYSESERERLHRQARFLEPAVHDRLPFRRRRRLIEVGVGVGAQTEILLRHFPELHVTGVEINDAQIAEARRFLATVQWATGRYDIVKGDATRLDFQPRASTVRSSAGSSSMSAIRRACSAKLGVCSVREHPSCATKC